MKVKSKNKSFYHWLVVAACCGMAISSIGIVTNCMGVFYSPVAESLGVGRGSVALFNTIVHLSTGFATPIIANLMKKLPLKPILLTGALLVAVGVTLLSTAKSVWVFYVISPFVGIGAACTSSMAILTVLNNWFKLSYGTASGLALACSGIGGAILAPTFSTIIGLIGWRMAFVAAGAVAAVASLPGILLVIRMTPQEKGLLPYGSTEENSAPNTPKAAGKKSSFAELFSLTFVLALLMGFLVSGMNSINSHLPGYAEELGFSSSIGALMVTCCMIGNISSKLILGVLCDTLGAVKGCYIMFASVISALLLFLFGPSDAAWLPLVAACLFGAVFSLGGIGFSQVIRLVYGPEKFPSVYAFGSVAPYIGTAVMNSGFGFIYDFAGTYRPALFITLAMAVSSVLLVFILNRRKENNT